METLNIILLVIIGLTIIAVWFNRKQIDAAFQYGISLSRDIKETKELKETLEKEVKDEK